MADGQGQLWDLTAEVPELVSSDGSTTQTQRFAGGQLLAETGSTTSYRISDAMGSVRTSTDAAGIAFGDTRYDVYGSTRTGPALSFGFTGEQHDPTGLVNLRARLYQPDTGTMLTTDPLFDSLSPTPGGPGLARLDRSTTSCSPHGRWPTTYGYGSANPTTLVDPTGLKTFAPLAPPGAPPGGGGGGGGGGGYNDQPFLDCVAFLCSHIKDPKEKAECRNTCLEFYGLAFVGIALYGLARAGALSIPARQAYFAGG